MEITMRNARKCFAPLLAFTAIAAAAATTATPASAGSPPLKTCAAAVKGTPWADPTLPLKGDLYVVRVATISCAKAEKLVAALVAQKVKQVKPGVYVATKPPAGDLCYVRPDTTKHAYIGNCAKSTGAPFVFIWSPGHG
jgi:hypothetical protein